MFNYITTIKILIFYNLFILTLEQFSRNGEPLNINWIFSLPYDVSNTLRAPLGGPLSLILTAGLALVMFFGMAVSPLYYLLGTPPRKYQPHDAILNRLEGGILDARDDRQLKIFENLNSSLPQSQDDNYPNFTQSFFSFIGEENVNCRKLMLCHAHGFFNFLPSSFYTLYRYFSRKMVSIPQEFQDAIMIGLEDQALCMPTFPNCSRDLISVTKKTFTKIVPTDLSFLSKYLIMFQNLLDDL